MVSRDGGVLGRSPDDPAPNSGCAASSWDSIDPDTARVVPQEHAAELVGGWSDPAVAMHRLGRRVAGELRWCAGGEIDLEHDERSRRLSREVWSRQHEHRGRQCSASGCTQEERVEDAAHRCFLGMGTGFCRSGELNQCCPSPHVTG